MAKSMQNYPWQMVRAMAHEIVTAEDEDTEEVDAFPAEAENVGANAQTLLRDLRKKHGAEVMMKVKKYHVQRSWVILPINDWSTR